MVLSHISCIQVHEFILNNLVLIMSCWVKKCNKPNLINDTLHTVSIIT
jgi:hypothetical protein